VFDLLCYKNRDLTRPPLLKRREMLLSLKFDVPKSSLKLVMAVVTFKETASPGTRFTIPPGANLENFSISEVFDNKDGKFTYWFGSASNKFLYLPKSTPRKISVTGSYTANYRTRHIKQELAVRQ
jgi:hypothetical protein